MLVEIFARGDLLIGDLAQLLPLVRDFEAQSLLYYSEFEAELYQRRTVQPSPDSRLPALQRYLLEVRIALSKMIWDQLRRWKILIDRQAVFLSNEIHLKVVIDYSTLRQAMRNYKELGLSHYITSFASALNRINQTVGRFEYIKSFSRIRFNPSLKPIPPLSL